jgi:predicted transcriptional regulator
MEVHLTPDVASKLSQIAAAQGRASEILVQEAVARLIGYDDWFLQEVDQGLAAANRGEYVAHEDVRKIIDTRFSD